MSNPDNDGWVEWSGGECPVPGKRVHYRMADGDEDRGPWKGEDGIAADVLRWHWIDDKWSDIIAYRVVQS